jgi:hypothetical protein
MHVAFKPRRTLLLQTGISVGLLYEPHKPLRLTLLVLEGAF